MVLMTPLLPVLLNRRGRIILITMHVGSLVCLSREARCQEAQVFPTIEGGCSSLDCINRPPAFLPPQHPVSPRGVLASHPGCLPQGGKKLEGSERGYGLLLDSTEELLSPSRICRSCGSTWGSIGSTAICFLSRLSTLMCVWSQSHREVILPINMEH